MQPDKPIRPQDRGRPGAYRRNLLSSALPAVLALIMALSLIGASLQRVQAAPQPQETILSIGYPQSGSIVSGVVTVQGTATASGFLNYSVYYAAGANVHGTTDWRYDDPIVDFVPTMIVNGVLGEWDTTGLPNGQYVLALAVRQSTTAEVQVAFVNNLTVYNELATPTPEPTPTPEVEEPDPESGEVPLTDELPPPVGATIELPPTATPRPTPTLTAEQFLGIDIDAEDDGGGLFSGDLFSVKAVKEAFSLGVQLAFLLYAFGILYVLAKAVIRYYLRQTRSKTGS